MALRLGNKINRQALQNICKSLYSGSTDSTCYPRSSSIDASASTLSCTSSSINNNGPNVSSSTNTGIVPPTTPVTNPPPSTASVQSALCLSQQTPNTSLTIGCDDYSLNDLTTNETLLTCSSASGSLQMPLKSGAYEVCPVRPRTTEVVIHHLDKNQFNSTSFNKIKKVVDKPVDANHLQPCNQPEFYITEKEDTSKASAQDLQEAVAQKSSLSGMKEPPASETNGGYRKFEESMTYRNLTQPFKFSRLANPFPDPVKETPSQKVTDQEKSAQMLQEARTNATATAHFAQRQKQLRLKPQVPLQPNSVRHYSSYNSGRAQSFVVPNPRLCKKVKKVKCVKLKTDKVCPPVSKSSSCIDSNYVYKNCSKKEAPYPSYSESCHEDHPSVCKSCPWMDDIHPAFKPKKKSFHTTSRAMSTTSSINTSTEANSGGSSHDMNDVNSVSDNGNGSVIAMELKKRNRRQKPDCVDNDKSKKVPCGWVEIDKLEDKERARKMRKKPKKSIIIIPEDTMDSTEKQSANVTENALQQIRDLSTDASRKKMPCLPTKITKRCPPSASQNLPINKKKRPPASPSEQPEKKAAATITKSSLRIYERERPPPGATVYIPEDVAIPAVGQSIDDWLAGLHPNKVEMHSNVVTISSGGPCRKFPFKPMVFELVIDRKPKPIHGHCPKRPKKSPIIDCPLKKDCLAELFDDVLVFTNKKTEEKDCPKVPYPLPVESETNDDPDDPCKKKRKPGSEICPGDLLTRRRKDKPFKRTQGKGDDFAQAVAMLDSIQRSKSAPIFRPYYF